MREDEGGGGFYAWRERSVLIPINLLFNGGWRIVGVNAPTLKVNDLLVTHFFLLIEVDISPGMDSATNGGSQFKNIGDVVVDIWASA